MLYYTDLHIHSKYSRATSKSCNLEELAIWAKKKGLSLIGTGDFTHPAWFAEIQEKLVPSGNGTFRLKPEIEKQIGASVKFILTVEISTIYKKWDKTRKVHHVVFMPNLETAQNFRQKLDAIGNIKSDGRPILGLDSRNLLETVLESGDDGYIIPAHIWTPWFSVLGSKSGFDSIEDCYGDLSEHIFAVETGLSSDPDMNWHVSKLDKFRLVSNSDAHSPSKLAREATVFTTDPDYYSIMHALKTGEGYGGTVEFFPEEGKYHEDGHRKCGVCLTPEETKKLNGICPVCGKPMTIGVLYRVNELSDRFGEITPPSTAGDVFSLVPLQEIISEINGVGPASKSVVCEYERLIHQFGSELAILQDIPTDEISKASTLLGEGISRLREGKVIKHAGYDGEYGVIRLFEDGELVKKNFVNLKLNIDIPKPAASKPEIRPLPKTDKTRSAAVHSAQIDKKPAQKGLDEFQQSAVDSSNSQLLITAGPGSGKTTVLTRRIAHLIKDQNITPESFLAITFTRRAAGEMRERLGRILGEKSEAINIHTFHSLCFSILKNNYEKAGLNEDFTVMSEQEKSLCDDEELLKNALSFDDLILFTVKLLEENPEILTQYKERFKYVSVDEFQDIDEHQYKLIRLLVPSNGNIFVIGDPNQAIYGFRGGDSKFFNNFKEDYPNTQIINLKNNYRSTNSIVDASNQMINCFNIVSVFDKPHEKITIHTAPTDKAEAEFIASTIEKLIGGHSFFSIDSERSEGEECDYSFSDFAILYRTSTQLSPILEALKRTGMPFVKLSNDLLCEQKPIRNLLKRIDRSKPVNEQFVKLSEEFKDKIDENVLKYLIDLSKNFTDKNDFLHEVSVLTEADTLDERADRIRLMTLHASKGLEFKCVFLAGLENEIIPLYRAKESHEIEEERRLLYVGMTRAKERLFLSHAQKRFWLGGYKNLEISPFLVKIKEDLFKLSKFEKTFREKDNSEQLSLF
ncbi:AAA family ATPase [Candidatus Gastranaerophilales bacterium]|nr:MAG: AAA family ATPase [Candidatus Gastranaerophilales bacterium]